MSKHLLDIASDIKDRIIVLVQMIVTKQTALSIAIKEDRSFLELMEMKSLIDSMIEEKRLLEACELYYLELDCY